MKKKRRNRQLKWSMIGMLAAGWFLPFLLISVMMLVVVSGRMDRQLENNIVTSTKKSVELCELRLKQAIESSKEASYLPTLKEAYADYLQDGDEEKLNRTSTLFIGQHYRVNTDFRMTYLYFIHDPKNACMTYQGYNHVKAFTAYALEDIMELSKDLDTSIVFVNINHRIYMVRNIVDGNFRPFAVVVTIVGQVGIALLLALLVDNIRVGGRFFRTVYFFPIVISATALGLLFNLIFLYDKGMLNQLLEAMGKKTLTDWKGEGIALFTMMLPVMWQYVGFYFVILITGLNNISEELYESAAIDGATRLQRVKYISIPLLHNVICTCVVLAVTGALKVFDLPWTMFPKGMPLKTTFLTGTYMYYQTMEATNVDYGSALAILIVVLGIVTSRVVNRIFKEKDF